jgi:tryptophan synthase alpha chain
MQESVSTAASRLVDRMRRFTELPIAVGFGISSAIQVQEIWQVADAAVVGSAIVREIERSIGRDDLVQRVVGFTKSLLP